MVGHNLSRYFRSLFTKRAIDKCVKKIQETGPVSDVVGYSEVNIDAVRENVAVNHFQAPGQNLSDFFFDCHGLRIIFQ